MAEIVFTSLVRERGVDARWAVDSAGTAAYHVGDGPDRRSVKACRALLGDAMIPVTQKARRVRREDFHRFEYIFCMDEENLADLRALRPKDATYVCVCVCVGVGVWVCM
jgi:protein-tyrosine-phosphatase